MRLAALLALVIPLRPLLWALHRSARLIADVLEQLQQTAVRGAWPLRERAAVLEAGSVAARLDDVLAVVRGVAWWDPEDDSW